MLHSLFQLSLRLSAGLAALSLFSLMVLTFADVMLRSLLNAPIEVAADLTRLLMAVTVFSVMPVVSAEGKQISVDLLDPFFARFGAERWRDGLVSLFCGAVLYWPTQRVWVLAERSRSYGDVMEYLGAPVHYIGWFIAVMTGVTAIALIGRGLLLLFWPHAIEDAS